MKNLTVCVVALLLPLFAIGQIIDSTYLTEYIVQKNGVKTEVDVIKIDDTDVYIFRNNREVKIPKKELLEWSEGSLWKQPFRYNDKGEIEYQEVVALDSLSKEAIYNRAKRMFVTLFKDSRNVLELDDKESGSLIGNGNTDVYYHTGYLNVNAHATFWFTIEIDIKDGRYRLTLNNFENEFAATQYTSRDRSSLEVMFPANEEPNKFSKNLKAADLMEIDSLMRRIKKMMAEKPSKDW